MLMCCANALFYQLVHSVLVTAMRALALAVAGAMLATNEEGNNKVRPSVGSRTSNGTCRSLESPFEAPEGSEPADAGAKVP